MNLRRRDLAADPAELLSITERARYLFGLRLGLAGVVIAVTLVADGEKTVAVSVSTLIYLALSLLSATDRPTRRSRRRPGDAGDAPRRRPLPRHGDRADGRDRTSRQVPAVRPRHRRDPSLLLSDGLEDRPVGHAAVPPPDRRRASGRPARSVGGRHRAGDRRRAPGGSHPHHRGLVGRRLSGPPCSPRRAIANSAGRSTTSRASPRWWLGWTRTRNPRDIPNVLLEELGTTFGFARGVVLASLHGDIELLAWTQSERPTDLAVGVDRSGIAGMGGTRRPNSCARSTRTRIPGSHRSSPAPATSWSCRCSVTSAKDSARWSSNAEVDIRPSVDG